MCTIHYKLETLIQGHQAKGSNRQTQYLHLISLHFHFWGSTIAVRTLLIEEKMERLITLNHSRLLVIFHELMLYDKIILDPSFGSIIISKAPIVSVHYIEFNREPKVIELSDWSRFCKI